MKRTKKLILQSNLRDEWMAIARQHGYKTHPGSTENWPTLEHTFGQVKVLVFDAPNTPFIHVSLLHMGEGFMSAQVSVDDLEALLERTARVLNQYATHRTWMDSETLTLITNALEFGP